MTGRSLVLPFGTDDPEFRRGVEIGMLWARLDHEDRFSATIHADNAEMILRVMEAKGVSFTASPLDENWLAVTIGCMEGGQWSL
jgi:hypothetical protein